MARSARPCDCGQYRLADGNNGTGCTATTTNRFAPGHDAKLKSWLIRQGIAGNEVFRTADDDPTQVVPVGPAIDVAKFHGYETAVQRGIDKGQGRPVRQQVAGSSPAAADGLTGGSLQAAMADHAAWEAAERQKVLDRQATAEWGDDE